MNQRIRELVGQAKFMAEETTNKQISKNAELDAFAEKFALLIVRECAERLLNDAKLTDIQTTRCVASIKQHFGVE